MIVVKRPEPITATMISVFIYAPEGNAPDDAGAIVLCQLYSCHDIAYISLIIDFSIT